MSTTSCTQYFVRFEALLEFFFFFSKRKNYFLPFKAEQNINFVEIHLKMRFFFSMIFFTILDVEKFHSGAILSEKI